MRMSTDLYSVAVIGTGTMGKGIVQILAQSNQISTVFWKGRSLASVNESLVELESQWSRQVKKGRLEESLSHQYREKIITVDHYTSLSDSKLIIEAIAENMDAKQAIFTELSAISSPDMVLASNSPLPALPRCALFLKT